MEGLREKIYNSFFYNLILNICHWASFSIFFKAKAYEGKALKKEGILNTGFYYRMTKISHGLEKVFEPFRKAFFDSLFVCTFLKVFNKLKENSLIFRVIGEFNLIYVLVLYIYVDKFVRTYMSGISGIWDELLIIVVIGWLMVRRILFNKRYVISSIDIPLVGFMVVYLGVMFIQSPELNIAIEGYRAVAQYMIWFFLGLQLIDSKKVLDRVIWLFVLSVGGLGLHGTYQYFTGAEMLGNWVDSSETISTRAYSIAGNPNALASVLVLAIPIALALFVAEKDILKKLLVIVACMFMGTGLIFTFTRGAWIAAFFAVIIFFFFVGRALIAPIMALLLTFVLSVDSMWTRLSVLFSKDYVGKASEGGRIYRWTTGIEEWSKSKLFGLGIGRYGGAVATNHKLAPFYMDNYYLKTLTESGLVGLSAYILLLLTTLYQMIQYIRATTDKFYRTVMFGLFSGLCGVLIHNGVENIFESPFMVSYFWTCVALLVAIYKIDRERKSHGEN